jgi:OPT family oligopeptide transporter
MITESVIVTLIGHEADKAMENRSANYGKSFLAAEDEEVDDLSPIEEVNLTVDTKDDPSIPIWTFRMWFLGTLSCALLSFLNQFFSYRTQPLSITALAAQIVCLPLGRLMAATLPKRVVGAGRWWAFSLNPGPFNVKEHVLITIFANAGYTGAYAINIITIVKSSQFFNQNISFAAAFLVTLTTQV